MRKELNPLHDLVCALNEQIELPTRMHTPRPVIGRTGKNEVIAAGYGLEPMPKGKEDALQE